MRLSAVGLMFAVALSLLGGEPARAEIFKLKNGGQVRGEWVNRGASQGDYVIKTSSGGRITLARDRVEEVLPDRRPELIEYERIRPGYPDTVEGQWALAEWCRRNLLATQRKTHLQRIIELDPDHADARRLLGYQKIGSQWATRKQLMTQRGYKFYKGRWRTSQEIELMERNRKMELAEKEWAQKIKRWRGWFGSEKASQGRENILAIKDPAAVRPLIRNLENEPLPAVRILYIEVLAGIGNPPAIRALAERSLKDRIEEVRLTCLDYLEKGTHPDVVEYYIGKLRAKLNDEVNLAAVALRRMNDRSAIGPLVDALITSHKFKIMPKNPGSTSASFPTGGSAGGGGLSMGGKPKIITRQFRNQPVLDALVSLSGQNFNFDQRAWRYWYESQRERIELDARRD